MRVGAASPNRGLIDALIRRPMLLATAIFMLGIGAHRALPVHPIAYAMAIPVFLAVLLVGTTIFWHAASGASLFLAGVSAAQIEAFCFPADHIAHFTSDEPALVRVELRIDTPPRLLRLDTPRPLPPRQTAQATVLRIETADGWRSASGATLLQIHEPREGLELGDRVQVFGYLQRPMSAVNPGQFDWERYYREHRILAAIHVPHANNVEILASSGPGFIGWLRQKVRDLLADGFESDESLDHALLRALVVGDPDPQLRDVQEQFVQTGTSHHLAISGLHVAVLGWVVFSICRLLLIGPRWSVWIGLAFVILYGLVALPSPPVVRSIILCSAFALGILWRRSIDGVQLLSVSVLIMLIVHPLDLYNAGFQLSCASVLGLMVLSRPLIEFAESLRDRDVAIAMQAQPPKDWRAVREWLRRTSIAALAPGLVAWAVSAPLIAYHFNQLNPWAILASLVLAIPVFFALVFGFAKIIGTLLMPPMAPALADLAAIPMSITRSWVAMLGKLPGSNLAMPKPSLWLLTFCFALLAIPLFPRPVGKWRWALRSAPALSVLILVSFMFIASSAPAPRGHLRLTMLSIGAGQCAVVHLPSGRTILIDAGSDAIANVGRECVAPYLKSAGVSKIDYIFVTHANQDHFNGVDEVVQRISTGHVLGSNVFDRQLRSSQPGRELLANLRELSCDVEVLRAGERIELDEHTSIEAIWPEEKIDLDANNASLVLKLTCNGQTILFAGDVQQPAQEQIVRDRKRLKADVLVAPHHGSSDPVTAKFISTVDPKVILCSNGRRLSRKQEQFNRDAAGRKLYRTSECGAISATIDPQGRISTETFIRRRTR